MLLLEKEVILLYNTNIFNDEREENMKGIRIITDSTSDLTPELYEKLDIEVIPLTVSIGGKSYADGKDINSEMLYDLVKEHGELPKTAAVPPGTLIKIFEKHIASGYDVLFICIGANFSANYQNACLAAKELPEGRVRIVDSGNLSSGIGLLLIKAAKFRDQGDSLEEIARKVEELVPLVRTQFAINTLAYLHKGGRCSGTSRIIGTVLRIKPIIRVVDGKMEVAKKPLGRFERALRMLLEYFQNDAENIDPEYVMVTHSMADEDVVYLREEIAKIADVENICETKAGAVISTHCGPRTIGILYLLKK